MEPDKIWSDVLPRLREFIGKAWDLELIYAYTEATPLTVGGWLVNIRPPVGQRLITLWYLLHYLGYSFPEMADLPRFNRYLGELIAFSVVTTEEACEIAGVRNPQTLLLILRGQIPMKPKIDADQLIELYGDDLQAKIEALPRHLEAETPLKDEPSQQTQGMKPSDCGDPLLLLASLFAAALPLTRYVTSDQVSAAQRSHFRDLLGQQPLFDLLGQVTALQSEAALKKRK